MDQRRSKRKRKTEYSSNIDFNPRYTASVSKSGRKTRGVNVKFGDFDEVFSDAPKYHRKTTSGKKGYSKREKQRIQESLKSSNSTTKRGDQLQFMMQNPQGRPAYEDFWDKFLPSHHFGVEEPKEMTYKHKAMKSNLNLSMDSLPEEPLPMKLLGFTEDRKCQLFQAETNEYGSNEPGQHQRYGLTPTHFHMKPVPCKYEPNRMLLRGQQVQQQQAEMESTAMIPNVGSDTTESGSADRLRFVIRNNAHDNSSDIASAVDIKMYYQPCLPKSQTKPTGLIKLRTPRMQGSLPMPSNAPTRQQQLQQQTIEHVRRSMTNVNVNGVKKRVYVVSSVDKASTIFPNRKFTGEFEQHLFEHDEVQSRIAHLQNELKKSAKVNASNFDLLKHKARVYENHVLERAHSHGIFAFKEDECVAPVRTTEYFKRMIEDTENEKNDVEFVHTDIPEEIQQEERAPYYVEELESALEKLRSTTDFYTHEAFFEVRPRRKKVNKGRKAKQVIEEEQDPKVVYNDALSSLQKAICGKSFDPNEQVFVKGRRYPRNVAKPKERCSCPHCIVEEPKEKSKLPSESSSSNKKDKKKSSSTAKSKKSSSSSKKSKKVKSIETKESFVKTDKKSSKIAKVKPSSSSTTTTTEQESKSMIESETVETTHKDERIVDEKKDDSNIIVAQPTTTETSTTSTTTMLAGISEISDEIQKPKEDETEIEMEIDHHQEEVDEQSIIIKDNDETTMEIDDNNNNDNKEQPQDDWHEEIEIDEKEEEIIEKEDTEPSSTSVEEKEVQPSVETILPSDKTTTQPSILESNQEKPLEEVSELPTNDKIEVVATAEVTDVDNKTEDIVNDDDSSSLRSSPNVEISIDEIEIKKEKMDTDQQEQEQEQQEEQQHHIHTSEVIIPSSSIDIISDDKKENEEPIIEIEIGTDSCPITPLGDLSAVETPSATTSDNKITSSSESIILADNETSSTITTDNGDSSPSQSVETSTIDKSELVESMIEKSESGEEPMEIVTSKSKTVEEELSISTEAEAETEEKPMEIVISESIEEGRSNETKSEAAKPTEIVVENDSKISVTPKSEGDMNGDSIVITGDAIIEVEEEQEEGVEESKENDSDIIIPGSAQIPTRHSARLAHSSAIAHTAELSTLSTQDQQIHVKDEDEEYVIGELPSNETIERRHSGLTPPADLLDENDPNSEERKVVESILTSYGLTIDSNAFDIAKCVISHMNMHEHPLEVYSPEQRAALGKALALVDVELLPLEQASTRYKNGLAWKQILRNLMKGICDVEEGFNETVNLDRGHLVPRTDGADQEEKTVESEATDVVCGVCFNGDSVDGNVVLFCDGCNLAVHQRCYGMMEVPNGDFFCDRCLAIQKKPSFAKSKPKPECFLCTVGSGALKRVLSIDGSRFQYAHITCVLWHALPIEDIPKLTFTSGKGDDHIAFHQSIAKIKSRNQAAFDELRNRRELEVAKADFLEDSSVNGCTLELTGDTVVNAWNTMESVKWDTKKLKDLTELDATEDIGIRISIPSQFSKDAIRNRGIKPDVSSSVTVKMSHKKKKKEVPVCGVCKQGKGLLSQCSCPDCDKFFHPLCAWYEGMLLRVKGHEHEFMFSHDSTRTFQLFCREHLPASVGIRDMLQQRDIRNRYRHVKKKHHGFVQTKQQIDLEKSKERQQHRIANDGSIQDIDEVINNSALDPDSYATEKCAVCFMNFEALPEDEANNMDNRRNKEPNNNNNNQQQQLQLRHHHHFSQLSKRLTCCNCGISVHQSCYQSSMPSDIHMWTCQRCEMEIKKKNVRQLPPNQWQCILCPRKGGALKRSDLFGGEWCHVTCALAFFRRGLRINRARELINDEMMHEDHIDNTTRHMVNMPCCVCGKTNPVGNSKSFMLRCGCKGKAGSGRRVCRCCAHPLCAKFGGHMLQFVDSGVHEMLFFHKDHAHKGGFIFNKRWNAWELDMSLKKNRISARICDQMKQLRTFKDICGKVMKREQIKNRITSIEEKDFHEIIKTEQNKINKEAKRLANLEKEKLEKIRKAEEKRKAEIKNAIRKQRRTDRTGMRKADAESKIINDIQRVERAKLKAEQEKLEEEQREKQMTALQRRKLERKRKNEERLRLIAERKNKAKDQEKKQSSGLAGLSGVEKADEELPATKLPAKSKGKGKKKSVETKETTEEKPSETEPSVTESSSSTTTTTKASTTSGRRSTRTRKPVKLFGDGASDSMVSAVVSEAEQEEEEENNNIDDMKIDEMSEEKTKHEIIEETKEEPPKKRAKVEKASSSEKPIKTTKPTKSTTKSTAKSTKKRRFTRGRKDSNEEEEKEQTSASATGLNGISSLDQPKTISSSSPTTTTTQEPPLKKPKIANSKKTKPSTKKNNKKKIIKKQLEIDELLIDTSDDSLSLSYPIIIKTNKSRKRGQSKKRDANYLSPHNIDSRMVPNLLVEQYCLWRCYTLIDGMIDEDDEAKALLSDNSSPDDTIVKLADDITVSQWSDICERLQYESNVYFEKADCAKLLKDEAVMLFSQVAKNCSNRTVAKRIQNFGTEFTNIWDKLFIDRTVDSMKKFLAEPMNADLTITNKSQGLGLEDGRPIPLKRRQKTNCQRNGCSRKGMLSLTCDRCNCSVHWAHLGEIEPKFKEYRKQRKGQLLDELEGFSFVCRGCWLEALEYRSPVDGSPLPFVGHEIQIYWPKDDDFFECVVTGCDFNLSNSFRLSYNNDNFWEFSNVMDPSNYILASDLMLEEWPAVEEM